MNADRLLAFYERIADAPDAIVRFRRFILDLAVRGKLVGQDPNDEPASELLKRIAAEKTRLVRAGQIRKQKAFPFLESPPFYVPENWRWARIREVTSDRGQKVPDAVFTYIDVTAIDKENGLIIGPRVLAPSEAPSRARKIIQRGDVIYSCVRPYLLNIAVIEDDYDPAPIASTAFAILNGHGFVLPRYLWITLRSPFMVACVEENQRGQAYPAINDADFAVLPLPLPPLAEQHRIVAKVDELMALCDRLEVARAEREATRDRLSAASLARLNAPDPDTDTFRNHAAFAFENLVPLTTRLDQIKALRQTILNLAVRGKLVEQDPGDEPASELLKRIASERKSVPISAQKTKKRPVDSPLTEMAFPLPTGWASAQLSELVRVLNGRAYKKTELLDSGTPILRVGNLFTSNHWYYSNLELEEDKYCDEGDLIYAWSASFGPFIWHGPSVIYHYHIWKLPLFTEENLDKQFLYFFLLQKTHEIKGAGHGISMVHMTKEKMEQLAVPLPPLAEQHRIVAKVEELMPLCDRLEASLATGDDTRRHLLDALLHEALSLSEEDIEQNISTITQELPDQSPEVLTEPTPAGTSSE